MPTAAQDQWLGKLGVNTLPAKSGRKSGAGTPLQAGAEAASATATLGKIPVPQVSGESKDALVKAMRTIDSIQPSDRAKGLFTIVTAEGTKQISKAQADDIRGKTKAALKRNISAVKLKAEAAMDRYSEQKKVNADQWAVAAVVTLARKVATLGRFEDPGPTLTKEVEAARVGVAAAAAAADANSFAKAAEAFADAEAAAARAAGMAQVYVAGMIEGAGASITVLEETRDLAFIAEAALATVATAGVASGAIAASTTALGGIGTVAAANVIATAAPIAGSIATAATEAALGDKVDWGAIAIDASLQLFIARFGGPATKGIAAAVTKRLAGKLAAESIARIGIEKMVQGLVLQEGSTALRTVAESTYAALRGKDITWEQFFKTLLTRLTDPKGLAAAAVVTAITSGAEMKYGGTRMTTGSAGGGEPPSSDKLFPELTEKEVGTAVDDATSGTPLPEINEATESEGTGADDAEQGSAKGEGEDPGAGTDRADEPGKDVEDSAEHEDDAGDEDAESDEALSEEDNEGADEDEGEDEDDELDADRHRRKGRGRRKEPEPPPVPLDEGEGANPEGSVRRKAGKHGMARDRKRKRADDAPMDWIVKGLNLDKDQRRRLHEVIGGQNWGPREILDHARGLFPEKSAEIDDLLSKLRREGRGNRSEGKEP